MEWQQQKHCNFVEGELEEDGEGVHEELTSADAILPARLPFSSCRDAAAGSSVSQRMLLHQYEWLLSWFCSAKDCPQPSQPSWGCQCPDGRSKTTSSPLLHLYAAVHPFMGMWYLTLSGWGQRGIGAWLELGADGRKGDISGAIVRSHYSS